MFCFITGHSSKKKSPEPIVYLDLFRCFCNYNTLLDLFHVLE